jgi:inorganic pyrophosphatase
MQSLTKLDTYDGKTGFVNVIVETPQGSHNKYDYDEKLQLFRISCLMPAGSVFPYDFGFIPSTLGDDGDPLDVLVLMEFPAPGGYLVSARLIGVIEAEQTENGTTERNDRLIAVSMESHRHKQVRSLSHLGEELVGEIEHFFITYNQLHGKKFKPLGRHGPKRATKLVKDGQTRFKRMQVKEA